MEVKGWLELDEHHKVIAVDAALLDLGVEGRVSSFTGSGRFENAIAVIQAAGTEFVVVPSTAQTGLGWAGRLRDEPGELLELYAAFGYTQEEAEDLFRSALAPPALMSMPWLLVERKAKPVWLPSSPQSRSSRVRVAGDVRIHYFDDPNGSTEEKEPRATYADVESGLAPPWRLLTPFEWEYVCRAEAQTLFWWGDQWPPLDSSPDDSGSFDLHRAPNSWGVFPSDDPFAWEFVAAQLMCGGDGGQGACGGEGPLGYWLPLSPSFRYDLSEFPRGVFGGLARRAAVVPELRLGTEGQNLHRN